MSTTTPTGQHHLADVASYAAAVRHHLVGLSADQVDDLTDGLEADLADALADSIGSPTAPADGADLAARFGSPATYAQELRSAAGLPDAGPPVERHRVRGLLTAPFRTVAGTARSALDRLRERPWWAPVEEFLVTLAPAAWLLRGWLVAKVVSAVLRALVPDGGAGGAWLPTTFLDWLLLIGLCIVSVQWGRGRWQDGLWSRRARRAATLVAVVAALPVFVAVSEHDTRASGVQVEYQTVYAPEAPQDGVVVGGMAVSNLFAYDAAGNPIEGVQIFDDRGRPVRTTSDDGRGDWSLPGVADAWSFVSAQDSDGRQLWNVYPLLGGPSSAFVWNDDLGQRVLPGGVTPRTPPRPFAKAPAVTLPGSTTTGTATGTTTGTTTGPTAGPTTAATAGPSADPTAGTSTDPTAGATAGAAAGPTAGAVAGPAAVAPDAASGAPTSTP